MGDPAGVGPELCCQLLNHPDIANSCIPIVFGSAAVIELASKKLGLSSTAEVLPGSDASRLSKIDKPAIIDLGSRDLKRFVPGKISAQTGSDSFEYIQTAISATQDGLVAGVATGPINKAAWKMAGINYPGHTELFAERFQTDDFCMMMTSPAFSCSLVTTHVGYNEVPRLLTIDSIFEVIQLTHAALKTIIGREPTLVALGLNPHAGEDGLFGDREEEVVIGPAVAKAVAAGIKIEGPIPPDTGFLPWRRDQVDGYICMYHDQGLIPFKAFNFDTGVNITLGLPMVRTSVDHGTALDIAWQGTADVASFVSAVKLAASLSANQTTN